MSQSHLDRDFIERQRQRLQAMREQAQSTQSEARREERRLQREWEEPRDIGDRGADVIRQNLDDAVERTEARRLTEIERALEKIETGSYGLSDMSGEPISRERLEAKPEALHTIEEEEGLERR